VGEKEMFLSLSLPFPLCPYFILLKLKKKSIKSLNDVKSTECASKVISDSGDRKICYFYDMGEGAAQEGAIFKQWGTRNHSGQHLIWNPINMQRLKG
jgi:hypothetical protein